MVDMAHIKLGWSRRSSSKPSSLCSHHDYDDSQTLSWPKCGRLRTNDEDLQKITLPLSWYPRRTVEHVIAAKAVALQPLDPP